MKFEFNDIVNLNISSLHPSIRGPFVVVKVFVHENDTSQPYYTLLRKFPHFFDNRYPKYFENIPGSIIEKRPYGLSKFVVGDIVKYDEDLRNGSIKVPYKVIKIVTNKIGNETSFKYHLELQKENIPVCNLIGQEEEKLDNGDYMYKVLPYETKYIPGCYVKIKGLSYSNQNAFRVNRIVESLNDSLEQHYLISPYTSTNSKDSILVKESILDSFSWDNESYTPLESFLSI